MPTRIIDAGIPIAQAALAVCGMASMAFVPPEGGTVLVMPVSPWAQPSAAFASDRGWRILGRGPGEGSLVASGNIHAAIWPALRQGLIVVAASPAICGEASDR